MGKRRQACWTEGDPGRTPPVTGSSGAAGDAGRPGMDSSSMGVLRAWGRVLQKTLFKRRGRAEDRQRSREGQPLVAVQVRAGSCATPALQIATRPAGRYPVPDSIAAPAMNRARTTRKNSCGWADDQGNINGEADSFVPLTLAPESRSCSPHRPGMGSGVHGTPCYRPPYWWWPWAPPCHRHARTPR